MTVNASKHPEEKALRWLDFGGMSEHPLAFCLARLGQACLPGGLAVTRASELVVPHSNFELPLP